MYDNDLKTTTIKIDKGRDIGKTFLITEMPLLKADRWACRMVLGMMRGGIDASAIDLENLNIKSMSGIFEIAKLGVAALGNVPEDLALELIGELTDNCIKIVPENGVARDVIWESDIKDISTLMLLRKESLGIHVDFLKQGDYLS